MTKLLDLDPDQLLTTTRAVRKRLDFERPLPLEVVKECIQVALQAPSGSNAQGWHFVSRRIHIDWVGDLGDHLKRPISVRGE